jgi:hypothetical protein
VRGSFGGFGLGSFFVFCFLLVPLSFVPSSCFFCLQCDGSDTFSAVSAALHVSSGGGGVWARGTIQFSSD